MNITAFTKALTTDSRAGHYDYKRLKRLRENLNKISRLIRRRDISLTQGVISINTNRNKIRSMAFISLSAALICLSSLFVIPLPFAASVLSLQTVFINITALCLKKNEALISISLYLFMGAIGLPVFSGGTSGLSKLLSPVGGYYFGFLLAVFLMSRFKGNKIQFKRYLAVTVLIGIPVEHIFAVLFMSLISSSGLLTSFLTVSLPFLIGDIIKAVTSAFIAVSLNKAIKNQL